MTQQPGGHNDNDNNNDSGKPAPSPPAGPHAREELTDDEKTPGTGALADKEGGEVDVGSD
jgi:hypothetical protein